MNAEMVTVTLSLISHTNAGKTTLARTLLRRDVGEVLDRPHVTSANEAHTMLAIDGAELRLWDTPGFGDSARLLQRLEGQENPLGWLTSQVWDRFANRPLHGSQQAVRNIRDEADVVLYLVNASEDPAGAAYIEMEMRLLGWIGKPVVVLLNQVGRPAPPEHEAGELHRWRDHLDSHACVRDFLSLDAFARCWVQEGRLLEKIAPLLPAPKRKAFRDLSGEWRRGHMEVFEGSMRSLGDRLSATFLDREKLSRQSVVGKARNLLEDPASFLRNPERKRAMRSLAERLDSQVRLSTGDLIRLHGLTGEAEATIVERLGEYYTEHKPADEGVWGAIGAAFSGAVSGLAADFLSGGLTFGGGAVAGGLLGLAGGAGIAKGYNLMKGQDSPSVRWSEKFCRDLVGAAQLRYLAVAHYGRGRGQWEKAEHPPFWREEVADALRRHEEEIGEIWLKCETEGVEGDDATRRLEDIMTRSSKLLLTRLHPESSGFLAE